MELYPASILYKSIADRYRPVSYPDGPITARYRFIKNAYWVVGERLLNSQHFNLGCVTASSVLQRNCLSHAVYTVANAFKAKEITFYHVTCKDDAICWLWLSLSEAESPANFHIHKSTGSLVV